MRDTLDSLKFLVIGPLILGMLAVINVMTSPGDWWVQWAALGIGIAWVICLLKVIRAVIVLGGLSALGVYLWKREQRRDDSTVPPPSA
jgi:hypothetical protein